MAHAAPIRQVTPEQGYRLWSRSYDVQPNPMLALEERYLRTLLPVTAGRDVVDFGCGTGRWLNHFVTSTPRTLTGIDRSSEMLARAAKKLPSSARLIQADCAASSLPTASADLIVASFVVGYLSDLGRFADELRRVSRDRCDIFISDIHPTTAAELAWNRGFNNDGDRVSIDSHRWSLDYLTFVFERAGFDIVTAIEPGFGGHERAILDSAGRRSVFESASGKPAIYILQLRPHVSRCVAHESSDSVSSIHGARIVLGSQESLAASVFCDNERIVSLGSNIRSAPVSSHACDLDGYTLFPGLVNAHDHLEFALFPRLGKGPYANALDWYADIHKAHQRRIEQHRRVPKLTRLYWGGLRNLLAGVTTVCHHNPAPAEMLHEDFPVRVVRDFRWAHSLPLSDDIAPRHRDTPEDQPFILHLGEGCDSAAANELYQLDRAGMLDSRTVIVHGLATSRRSRSLINSRRASLIWCPSSNVFLFGHTHTANAINSIDNVALGSDSPISAVGDFLDELRFARDTTGMATDALFRQVTTSAASILRLCHGQGQIRVGASADLIALRNLDIPPCELLARASWRDIHLVIKGGRVFLAAPEIMNRLPRRLTSELRPLLVAGELRWVRAPLARMFADTVPALGCADIAFHGRRLQHAFAAWL